MTFDRVAPDSNVLIRAAISPRGKAFACLSWVIENATLISAREVIEEVETRLARTKFARYVDSARRREFVADLRLAAVLIELTLEVNLQSFDGRIVVLASVETRP